MDDVNDVIYFVIGNLFVMMSGLKLFNLVELLGSNKMIEFLILVICKLDLVIVDVLLILLVIDL